MSIKGFEKSITVIMLLGFTLGSITYGVNMTNTISQLKADFLESQDQLLKNQSQLQDQLLETQQQITQEPRYTGNPFATELWPGQIQSENITGMHWYSWNGTGLQNCTDNVLGLGEVELTKQIWASFRHRIAGGSGFIAVPAQLNTLQVDTCATLFVVPHDFTDWIHVKLVMDGPDFNPNLAIKGYAGACGEATDIHNQTIVKDFDFTAGSGSFTCIDLLTDMATFFEALSPGDYVEIRIITNEVGIVYAYGLDLRYN